MEIVGNREKIYLKNGFRGYPPDAFDYLGSHLVINWKHPRTGKCYLSLIDFRCSRYGAFASLVVLRRYDHTSFVWWKIRSWNVATIMNIGLGLAYILPITILGFFLEDGDPIWVYSVLLLLGAGVAYVILKIENILTAIIIHVIHNAILAKAILILPIMSSIIVDIVLAPFSEELVKLSFAIGIALMIQ